jgi:hypothetical protein
VAWIVLWVYLALGPGLGLRFAFFLQILSRIPPGFLGDPRDCPRQNERGVMLHADVGEGTKRGHVRAGVQGTSSVLTAVENCSFSARSR